MCRGEKLAGRGARECAKNGNCKRTAQGVVRLQHLCEICERFMSCMLLPIGVLPARGAATHAYGVHGY